MSESISDAHVEKPERGEAGTDEGIAGVIAASLLCRIVLRCVLSRARGRLQRGGIRYLI